MLRPERLDWPRKQEICIRLKDDMRKLIENTIVDSNPSWTTGGLLYGGWWKFLRRDSGALGEYPYATAGKSRSASPCSSGLRLGFSWPSTKTVGTSPSLPAIVPVALSLSFALCAEMSPHRPKEKEETRVRKLRVRDRLQPDTTSPTSILDSGRRCRAKESPCWRATSIAAHPRLRKARRFREREIFPALWGQRAALALGYDDYSKEPRREALNCCKSQGGYAVYEYTLF